MADSKDPAAFDKRNVARALNEFAAIIEKLSPEEACDFILEVRFHLGHVLRRGNCRGIEGAIVILLGHSELGVCPVAQAVFDANAREEPGVR